MDLCESERGNTGRRNLVGTPVMSKGGPRRFPITWVCRPAMNRDGRLRRFRLRDTRSGHDWRFDERIDLIAYVASYSNRCRTPRPRSNRGRFLGRAIESTSIADDHASN